MDEEVFRVPRTLYRAMLPDAHDGLPHVGSESNMLGVRPGVDIRTSQAGPGRGGLSVTVDVLQKMNVGVRPKAFGGMNNKTAMFELASIILDAHPMLRLGPIRNCHALIEAASICAIEDFQLHLAATRLGWSRTQLPFGALGR